MIRFLFVKKLKKAQVIEAMAIEKVDESTMSPKDKIVKDKLDLNIGSIQQRLKIVSIRRKHLHAYVIILHTRL